MKMKIKRISKFESACQYRLNSAAIRNEEPSDFQTLAQVYYDAGDMTKKEAAKHEWIVETQMFQRIAKTGEDSYEELSIAYDEFYEKKSTRTRQEAAENAKINRIILEQAGEAGRKRTN